MVPFVEPLEHTQYPAKIPTSRLKQSVLIPISVLIQQTVATILLVNIAIVNGLLSMVMMFYFNSQEGLIHVHNWMDNYMEVCMIEDHQEEENM
jgi:hypothetical protein